MIKLMEYAGDASSSLEIATKEFAKRFDRPSFRMKTSPTGFKVNFNVRGESSPQGYRKVQEKRRANSKFMSDVVKFIEADLGFKLVDTKASYDRSRHENESVLRTYSNPDSDYVIYIYQATARSGSARDDNTIEFKKK